MADPKPPKGNPVAQLMFMLHGVRAFVEDKQVKAGIRLLECYGAFDSRTEGEHFLKDLTPEQQRQLVAERVADLKTNNEEYKRDMEKLRKSLLKRKKLEP
jgi:hypothetical protein